MRNALALLCAIAALFLPSVALGAEGKLYLEPKSGVYRVGDTFSVVVLADTDAEQVSAIEGELAYNPLDFEVEDITTEGSVLTTWSTQPSFDGAAGQIRFSGWADTPYSGTEGTLVTFRLRALRPTQSTIVFNAGSMLSAQSRGSNILTSMLSGGYTVAPKQEEVVPPELPLEEEVAQPQGSSGLEAAAIRATASESQTAALINATIDFIPLILIFFGLLIAIAFAIAYILHKRVV